jgi:hypothetical protein
MILCALLENGMSADTSFNARWVCGCGKAKGACEATPSLVGSGARLVAPMFAVAAVGNRVSKQVSTSHQAHLIARFSRA